jgi:hypothetical protein
MRSGPSTPAGPARSWTRSRPTVTDRAKHVERARIVLASADRHSAQQVAQSIGISSCRQSRRETSGAAPRRNTAGSLRPPLLIRNSAVAGGLPVAQQPSTT